MKKLYAVLLLIVIALLGLFAYDYYAKEARQRELQAIISRLTAESRVAQVVVKDRATDPSGVVTTKIQFLEWDRQGKRLPPIDATLTGQEVYFEALVIKFENEYVEKGDALRGKAIILFRRIFGAAQAPDAGVLIDAKSLDGIPSIYRVSDKPSAFEADLWKRFWYYADHPEEWKKLGVRVIQCKAVGNRLTPNSVWDLKVESGGDINLIPATPRPD